MQTMIRKIIFLAVAGTIVIVVVMVFSPCAPIVTAVVFRERSAEQAAVMFTVLVFDGLASG